MAITVSSCISYTAIFTHTYIGKLHLVQNYVKVTVEGLIQSQQNVTPTVNVRKKHEDKHNSVHRGWFQYAIC